MSKRNSFFLLLVVVAFLIATGIPTNSQVPERNVNMVEGQTLPGGDPWLQRQNEPSLAVSTRNPLHLLAGANDYRTVEIPIPGEELPGLPEGTAAGDAWLGVFKSFDGGESWMSTLLPGYPQDGTLEGTNSLLYGFQAAADPTVRAGANGLFYYSGIAFNRVEHGRSVVFVARYIDNNNIEDPNPENDPIKYIDTKIIDEGTSGQFADKPWIAADIPSSGAETVQVNGQYIPRHSVYIVYSLFLGDLAEDVHNKILFARSTDCGNTWEHPIKLSESQHINQGTTLAIDPSNGNIYVAWRRFASEGESNAIMFCKSTDGGQKFSKATAIAEINPFDQGTTVTSFRTNAFPTIAVDSSNNVYLAWSERDASLHGNAGEDARIVIITGENGKNWPSQELVDDYDGHGHQIMPSITFAAGKLMMAWYDFREDVAGNECTHWENYISDDHNPNSCNFRHTVDVRIAEASLEMNPGFNESVQVSRYYWIMEDDGTCFQAQFNPPNYPLFKQGTVPFIGDYIDICPSPRFILENGEWRFNTESEDPSIFHVTWTDNRDVRPPFDGNWTIYNPPNSDQPVQFPAPPYECQGENAAKRTGMRNQNIYTSRIIPGIEVSSLGNTKSLDIQRAFVICVKNTTEGTKYFQLTIANQPLGGQASFFQSGNIVDELPVDIAPHSSISRPVFVQSSVSDESVRINVKELDEQGNEKPGGLQSFIVLNPDPTNPVVDPGNEIHDPIIESLLEVNLVNANLVNANLVNQNIPDVNLVNANLVNANLVNVNLVNANLVNANLVNPSIYDSVNLVNVNLVNASVTAPDAVTDVQWKVTNNGNTTSSYTFRSVAPESLPGGLYAQLIIYRAHTTPGTDGENCELMEVPHHEVLVNLVNPHIIDPNVEDVNLVNPDLGNSAIWNATFALAPGEEAIVALRIIKNAGSGLSTAEAIRTAEEFTEDVGVGITSHSLNTGETEYSVSTTPLQIFTLSLPNGAVGTPYSKYIKIFGGTGPYTWSIPPQDLPKGLSLVNPQIDEYTREIFDMPEYDSSVSYPHLYDFTLQVIDANGDFDTQDLSIFVLDKLEILTTSLPDGILGNYYNQTLAAKGGIGDYTWSISPGELPDGLNLVPSTGVISGDAIESGTFNFTVKVTDPGPPEQEATATLSITILALNPTISGTVNFGGGGLPGVTIEAQGTSGDPITTTTDSVGYYSFEVDLGWTGTVTPSFEDYLFYPPSRTYDNPVIADQTGQDYTAYIEDWVEMYNNDSVNGDDEASAIAIDSSFVYVTGYSTGKTTGEDYATVKYHSSGNMEWDVKYDGPSHEGDFANAIAVDSSGRIYVTGYSYRGIPHKHADYYTVKYDSSRNVIWDVRYDSRRNGNDVARAMVLDLSGNLWVTGKSEESLGSGDKDHDYYTVKYDANNGKRLWHDRFDGPGDGDDEARAIAVDSSGVYVTGKIAGNGTGFDYYTVKYDVNIKKKLWEATYDGPGDDEAAAIAVDSSGNVYVTGRSFKGSGTGFDYCTIKYNKNGIQQWVTPYNGPGNGHDEAVAIAVDSSGVYVTGKITGNGTGFDYCTVKYDKNGNQQWATPYNGPGNGHDEAAALAIDSTGVYVTGKSQRNGTDYDYATVKYDFSGNVVLIARYEGPGDDEARAIAVESRYIYVTGSSQGSTTSKDYATIKYIH